MCTKCHSKLDDFKGFLDQCLENEKTWGKFKEDEDLSEKNESIEYLEEYIEDIFVEDIEKIEDVQHEEIVKKKPKKKIVVQKSLTDKNTEENEKIRKFFDLQCHKCDPAVDCHTFNEYKLHLKTVHATLRPAMLCCGKKLSKRMDLIDHMDFHLDPDKLKCSHCQRVYSDRKNLKAHVIHAHGTAEQKPYQCDPCGKRYAKLDQLRSHMRCHLSEETKQTMKNYICNECGQFFLTEAVLKSHIKYTHLRQGYICVHCARHFKSKFDYHLHRRNMHGEEGPSREQCPLCQKWYSNSKALRGHIRTYHERTAPIICKICGMETTSKQGLYGHMRMKHKERAYHCDFCPKSFQTPCRLKEHRATHTGISLYSCTYCPDKHFNVRANMYKHFKAIHPEEWKRDKADKNRNPQLYKGPQSRMHLLI